MAAAVVMPHQVVTAIGWLPGHRHQQVLLGRRPSAGRPSRSYWLGGASLARNRSRSRFAMRGSTVSSTIGERCSGPVCRSKRATGGARRRRPSWGPSDGAVRAHPRYVICRPQAPGHCARPGGSRTSRQRLQRHPTGPVAPQVMPATGGNSHAWPGGRRPSCRTARKITGEGEETAPWRGSGALPVLRRGPATVR
jgi:hypothetical protein